MYMFSNLRNKAEEMIRRTGDRVTNKRIHILSVLLSEQQALTHREIEERVTMKHQLDRVTLYRILEWLSKRNLVHKIASDDRVWRFRVNSVSYPHHHAHFKCTCCTKVTCLKETNLDFNALLPDGYRFQEAEITVMGLCAECVL